MEEVFIAVCGCSPVPCCSTGGSWASGDFCSGSESVGRSFMYEGASQLTYRRQSALAFILAKA